MAELPVTITRFVEDHSSGRVECAFTDADGHAHAFLAKGAAVSHATLSAASHYPQAGLITVYVEAEWGDHTGLDLARVTLVLADDGAEGDAASYVVLASDLR